MLLDFPYQIQLLIFSLLKHVVGFTLDKRVTNFFLSKPLAEFHILSNSLTRFE
jgi:hypothetical protein